MDKASFVRMVGLVASFLAYFSINIPESTVELIASLLFGAFGLYAAYKNNYLFTRGQEQKEVLRQKGLYERNK